MLDYACRQFLTGEGLVGGRHGGGWWERGIVEVTVGVVAVIVGQQGPGGGGAGGRVGRKVRWWGCSWEGERASASVQRLRRWTSPFLPQFQPQTCRSLPLRTHPVSHTPLHTRPLNIQRHKFHKLHIFRCSPPHKFRSHPNASGEAVPGLGARTAVVATDLRVRTE